MSQYILINRLKVQNANAISGFTYGFPAITNFLGFIQSLKIKLAKTEFNEIDISGCMVIAHEHYVHTHGDYNDRFTQTKNPGAMSFEKDKAGKNPSIIEEGRMNMTVSLLVSVEGNLADCKDHFLNWLENQCYLHRLAGGIILDIGAVQLFNLNEENNVHLLKRQLLPGFALMDRSSALSEHYQHLLLEDEEVEMLDAWLDFSALKQAARPKHNLITKHLEKQVKNNLLDIQFIEAWQSHLSSIPFKSDAIPKNIENYFNQLDQQNNKVLLEQWHNYLTPSNETPADWEFIPKPVKGYLVPIVTGYKAISKVYENNEIANTRDDKTQVCFVEAAHSVGEWRGINRFNKAEDFVNAIWSYHYEENWYLCKQLSSATDDNDEIQALDVVVTEVLTDS